MFGATAVAVYYTGQIYDEQGRGWPFAVALLGILLVHEFAHYVAARVHGVPASLPFFIPAPFISPFGTLGAVIDMPVRIRSRNALLDVGASGPIAGMVVAIPVILYGLSASTVAPISNGPYSQEGQSILYWLVKRLVLGPMPDGHDVIMHPVAAAGWAGFFLTMLNLCPWGQLDGGHIAYAMLGRRHHAVARWVRRACLILFAYNIYAVFLPVLPTTDMNVIKHAASGSSFWLTWYIVLGIIAWRAGTAKHPPTDPGTLSPVRWGVGIFSLVLAVLLFVPTPWVHHP